MDRDALIAAFTTAIPEKLATELVDDFLEIRSDVATETLGRGGPGRFVESLVQVLQHLETGSLTRRRRWSSTSRVSSRVRARFRTVCESAPRASAVRCTPF